MTEAEWLACGDPTDLLLSRKSEQNRRKLQLFVCAACRRLWPAIEGTNSQRVLEISERDADDEASATDVTNACGVSSALLRNLGKNAPGYHVRRAVAWSAFARSNRHSAEFALRELLSHHGGWDAFKHLLGRLGMVALRSERRAQVQLLRDIFGNPFQLIGLSPEWRTGTTVALAQHMYESRDFSAMPILADALQDAGCDSGNILAHCRDEGVHVRGCWVVDLVLGKS